MTETDDDQQRKRRKRDTVIDVMPVPEIELPGQDVLEEVSQELQAGIDDVTPNPEDIEDAFSQVEVDAPELDDLDPDVEVLPDASVARDHADAVVDAGGEAVEVAVEGSGEAATVLVDTGDEVVEIAVDGGETAAKVTAEVAVEMLFAPLDGL